MLTERRSESDADAAARRQCSGRGPARCANGDEQEESTMLPPIPSGVIPVTAQQDAVKPRPDVAPVTPVQASAQESAVSLDRRHPQDAQMRLREELRRRQRRDPSDDAQGDGPTGEVAAAEALPGETDEPPPQGRWVDVEV